MQTLTVQVTNKSALKAIHLLQDKHLVRIVDDSDLHSPALPGSPMPLKAFKNWIADAEAASTISLKDAKQKWASKRKQLVKLTK
jgi:inosine/xanthosine triphosphate pyrophosphatase family protein